MRARKRPGRWRAPPRRHPRLPARISRGQRADAHVERIPSDLLHLQRDRPLQPILASRASCILRREVQWADVRTLSRLHLRAQGVPRYLELERCVR